MHQPTDEEPGGLKDRERSRPIAPNTRQTLSAVGRVASRVRNSGMSKLTKANSFLRQKDGEQPGKNESPWGVGVSASSTAENPPSRESTQSNDIDKLPISPRGEGASDMVELSSPLSADQYSPLRLTESATQRSMKEGESLQKEHTGDRIGQNRIEGDRKVEKRNERPSAVQQAAGAARGLVKSVSKFGFRNSDRKGAIAEGALNDLSRARSAMPMLVVDLKDTKTSKQIKARRTSDVGEDSTRPRGSTAEPDLYEASSQDEAVPDVKTRGFFLPGLGRKSKLGPEWFRTRTGLPQSGSNGHILSPKTTSSGGESPLNSPNSELSHDGKKTRRKKPSKDLDHKPRKTRASWFAFSGESGDSQTKGIPPVGKGKARARREHSLGENEIDSELGSRVSGKASKDLSDMRDFAVDEYFDSEEDDMETGSAPRSLAEDDFITYQTGKGKKGQGNRAKNRMKPQT